MPDDPKFSADSPLTNPVDDKLERKKFSFEVAKSLGTWEGKESLIVSICGEWGSGKTTIRNFIQYYLREDFPKVKVVDFNPWQ